MAGLPFLKRLPFKVLAIEKESFYALIIAGNVTPKNKLSGQKVKDLGWEDIKVMPGGVNDFIESFFHIKNFSYFNNHIILQRELVDIPPSLFLMKNYLFKKELINIMPNTKKYSIVLV